MDKVQNKMQRTKITHPASSCINCSNFSFTPVALAITALFLLSGCEQKDDTVSLYQNADDCAKAHPGQSAQCKNAYHSAMKEAARTAPKYATREECVAEFGEQQCQQTPSQAGFSAPHQAESQQSGSFWMPLMAGYMMGRMMNGGASQPLFTSRAPGSPAQGKFVDATGSNYGAATTGRSLTVPKTAMSPKPATTSTITRGGFGDSVARQRQSTLQHKPAPRRSASLSSGSRRSFGG